MTKSGNPKHWRVQLSVITKIAIHAVTTGSCNNVPSVAGVVDAKSRRLAGAAPVPPFVECGVAARFRWKGLNRVVAAAGCATRHLRFCAVCAFDAAPRAGRAFPGATAVSALGVKLFPLGSVDPEAHPVVPPSAKRRQGPASQRCNPGWGLQRPAQAKCVP